MDQVLLAMFLGAIPSAVAGCLVGYFVAIHEVPKDEQLTLPQLTAFLMLNIFGAAVFTVGAQYLLVHLFPASDLSPMTAVFGLVISTGLALFLTPRLTEHGWEISFD